MDATDFPPRRKRRTGLRLQLLLLALVSALPFVATTVAEVTEAYDETGQAQRIEAQATARRVAAQMEREVAGIDGFMAAAALALAQRFDVPGERADLLPRLKALRSEPRAVLALFGRDGQRLLASSADFAVLDASEIAWFRDAVRSRLPGVTQPMRAGSSNAAQVTFTRPVLDAHDRVLGVLAYVVDLATFEDRLRSQVPAAAVAWIDSPPGLAEPPVSAPAAVVAAWRERTPVAALGADERLGELRIGPQRWTVGEVASATLPWRIVVALEARSAWLTADLLLDAAALCTALLLSLGIAFLTSRRHARPMLRLGEAFARLSRGEPAVRVVPEGCREMDQLGHDFNHMAAELEASRAALLATQARLSGYLRTSSDWLWTTDAQMRIAEIDWTRDPAFALRRHLMLGRPIWDVAQETAPGGWDRVRAAIAAAQPIRDFECWRVGPEGNIVYLSLSAEPMRDASGAVAGYRGVAREITQLVLATRALEAERERFTTIVETMSGGVAIVDAEGRFRYVNPRAAQILGAPRERIEGAQAHETPWSRGDLEGAPMRSEQLVQARVLATGQPVTEEGRVVRSDGSQVFVRVHGVPITDDRGRREALITLEDITASVHARNALAGANRELERRVALRTAQLTERVDELNELTYTVSHDLRAPLRAIDGWTAILGEEAAARLDPAELALLGRIGANARLMGGMVDALLDYANLAKRPLRLASFPMAAVVQEALAQIGPEAQRPGLRIEIANLGSCIADRAMVRELWVQLLSNALRFTARDAAAWIVVEIAPGEGESGWRVSDNGDGFDMSFMDQLFGVFQTLGRPGGLGIGLAVARRIVERHGGRITARSEPGLGAAFTFTLGAVAAWRGTDVLALEEEA